MKSTYILSKSDPLARLKNVGGKGLSLARPIGAGLPVPDGFHVTTEAYRQFVALNGLQSNIIADHCLVNIAIPASLETASHSIKEVGCYERKTNRILHCI